MLELELWGLIFVSIVLFYTSLGGISGGGLCVPVFLAFMRFDAKQAIGLSNASICIGGLLRVFYFANEPHPLKNGKGLLIDHNLAVLGLPLIIMGVSFGVLLNIIVPNVFIVGFFVCMCLYLSYGLTKKAFNIYSKENEST